MNQRVSNKQRLCKDLQITMSQLNQFMRMVEKYVRQWVKANNNQGDFSVSDQSSDNATLFAKKLGLSVDWSPGLYPTIIKNGQEFHLPYQ